MEQEFSSSLLENAVSEFAKLPGIGRKTALRLVLHLLKRDKADVEQFASAMVKLRSEIRYCRMCHNISESEVCPICSNPSRDTSTVCVVENVKDVMSIENTHQHHGLYHVLGGLISPMDGVGPQDIEIDSLVDRVKAGGVKEVILALSATMEGDTTNFYIFRRLAPYPDVKITMLARGVSVGNEIEYTDDLTLGRSIQNRILFSDTFAAQRQ
ncbi:MAG: recombination mediator RecR [Bacteroidales bacterium]|nr:recombination mediator RecR [Bacteroidales bacterium]